MFDVHLSSMILNITTFVNNKYFNQSYYVFNDTSPLLLSQKCTNAL